MTQLSFPAISTLIPLKSSLKLDLAPLSSLSSNLHFLQSLNYERDNCTINTPTLTPFLNRVHDLFFFWAHRLFQNFQSSTSTQTLLIALFLLACTLAFTKGKLRCWYINF
jgi:hypothetical protein